MDFHKMRFVCRVEHPEKDRALESGCLGPPEPRMPVSEFQDASLEPGAKFCVLVHFYTTILTESTNLAYLAHFWQNLAH